MRTMEECHTDDMRIQRTIRDVLPGLKGLSIAISSPQRQEAIVKCIAELENEDEQIVLRWN